MTQILPIRFWTAKQQTPPLLESMLREEILCLELSCEIQKDAWTGTNALPPKIWTSCGKPLHNADDIKSHWPDAQQHNAIMAEIYALMTSNFGQHPPSLACWNANINEDDFDDRTFFEIKTLILKNGVHWVFSPDCTGTLPQGDLSAEVLKTPNIPFEDIEHDGEAGQVGADSLGVLALNSDNHLLNSAHDVAKILKAATGHIKTLKSILPHLKNHDKQGLCCLFNRLETGLCRLPNAEWFKTDSTQH